jgi:hypothetical protein
MNKGTLFSRCCHVLIPFTVGKGDERFVQEWRTGKRSTCDGNIFYELSTFHG